MTTAVERGGPWETEGDLHYGFAHGLLTVIWRHPYHLSLTGYVAVPAGHPWYGLDYNDVPADVHGGLTFAGPPGGPLVADGDTWFLGFDCNHAWDYAPGMPDDFGLDGIYRDLEYVRGEVESPARQAADAASRAGSRTGKDIKST